MHDMRRFNQALTEHEATEVLERGTWGTLAVCGADAMPYAVPLNYVLLNGALYFHCALQGHKLEALAENPQVSFCVVDRDTVLPEQYTSAYVSVIVFGSAHIVEDADEKRTSLAALGRKYNPMGTPERLEQEMATGIERLHMVRIDIERMTGKQAKELVSR